MARWWRRPSARTRAAPTLTLPLSRLHALKVLDQRSDPSAGFDPERMQKAAFDVLRFGPVTNSDCGSFPRRCPTSASGRGTRSRPVGWSLPWFACAVGRPRSPRSGPSRVYSPCPRTHLKNAADATLRASFFERPVPSPQKLSKRRCVHRTCVEKDCADDGLNAVFERLAVSGGVRLLSTTTSHHARQPQRLAVRGEPDPWCTPRASSSARLLAR